MSLCNFSQEKDNLDSPKIQFLAKSVDDGSYWGEWSDWSPCAATCGDNNNRSKTRSCFNAEGEVISSETGYNCLPDILLDTYEGSLLKESHIQECPTELAMEAGIHYLNELRAQLGGLIITTYFLRLYKVLYRTA